MLHHRSTSSTLVGPLGVQRPTVHLEHPPSIPRSALPGANFYQDTSSSPTRPPASFTRSTSTRNAAVVTPAKRPSSSHSSRQSSSDSISSVTTASSFTRTSAGSFDSETTAEQDLVQVVYTSSARSRQMSVDEVKSILRASRLNNTSKAITGLLLYRDGSFAQFLEGPADAVDGLYDKIERDPRHHGVIRVLRQSVTKRDFREWSMAFRDLDMIEKHRHTSTDSEMDDPAPEDHVNEGFNQLMNVGLRVGDSSDYEYRPDALGNAKIDLPADMSAPMRKLVTTFYRLMDRPL